MKRAVLPLVAVGVLVSCGGADGTEAEPVETSMPAVSAAATPAPPSSPTQSPLGSAEIPEALKFAAPLVGGGDIELTTLAGRPVLLWFWAPW